MLQFSNLVGSAMEAENHVKHGASLKSLMSKDNLNI